MKIYTFDERRSRQVVTGRFGKAKVGRPYCDSLVIPIVLQHTPMCGRLALILDETPDVRVLLTAMLTHAGLRTAAVSNFADARQAISDQRMNGEEAPVVFVSSTFALDVTAEITGLLADVAPAIVIVICTQHVGAGCCLFDPLPCGEYLKCMHKPFTYPQFLQTIEAMHA